MMKTTFEMRMQKSIETERFAEKLFTAHKVKWIRTGLTFDYPVETSMALKKSSADAAIEILHRPDYYFIEKDCYVDIKSVPSLDRMALEIDAVAHYRRNQTRTSVMFITEDHNFMAVIHITKNNVFNEYEPQVSIAGSGKPFVVVPRSDCKCFRIEENFKLVQI